MSEVQQAVNAEALEERDAQNDLYLTFTIGNEVYGIGIEFVKEIIGIQPIAEIPDFPDHIRGVINLRGKIIPVMDVRLRFKKPLQAYDTRTCIIVVDILSTSIGLIVDRVAEVVVIPEEEIAPPPEINRRDTGIIRGFGKAGGEIKRLLDLSILLSDETAAVRQKVEGE